MVGNLNIYAIRGATTLNNDSAGEMDEKIALLFSAILDENKISEEDIAYILLSQTSDLRKSNAASSLRRSNYCSKTPLFCLNEAEVDNALEKCVRIMVVVGHEAKSEIKMVYQGKAKALRPDLVKEKK